MVRYEYKVIPAPEAGKKGKGIKGPKQRFAFALESLMNELGAEGWDYVRADTLPAEERTGLTGTKTVYQNMLVFRRALDVAEPARNEIAGLLAAPAPDLEPEHPEPEALSEPEAVLDIPAPAPAPAAPASTLRAPDPIPPRTAPAPKVGATVDADDVSGPPLDEVESEQTAAANAAAAALIAYRRQARRVGDRDDDAEGSST